APGDVPMLDARPSYPNLVSVNAYHDCGRSEDRCGHQQCSHCRSRTPDRTEVGTNGEEHGQRKQTRQEPPDNRNSKPLTEEHGGNLRAEIRRSLARAVDLLRPE